jgi:putative hydrolase of the HAD superfamily
MIEKIKIKAVSFDFWTTLYDETEENWKKSTEKRIDILKKLSDKYDIKIIKNELVNIFKQEQEAFYNIWKYQHRTLTTEERINFTLDKLNLSLENGESQKLIDKYSRIIFDYPPLLAPNIKNLLEYLNNEGFIVGIISDTGYASGKILKELMEMDGILKYFKAFSFSDETGVAKPHIKAYSRIMKDFKIDNPKHILHIGDLERTDISGAINAGMFSCRYIGLTKNLDYDKFSTKADFYIDDWDDLRKYIAYY